VDNAPFTDDLDLSAVSTRAELAGLLREIRLRADKPSLRALEASTRHTSTPLSKSAVAEMLRGARLPRKARMIAFLKACGMRGTDIESWQRAWERVAAMEERRSQSRTSTPSGAGMNEETAEGVRDDHTADTTNIDGDPAVAEEGRDQDRSRMPTLARTFARIAGALRLCLVRDSAGTPIGWRSDLRELSGGATPLATAYGIRAMLLLENGLAADLVAVAAWLSGRSSSPRCWRPTCCSIPA
jgi:hypothetical protein